MTILEQTYKGLVNKYQQSNRRNSYRVAKAAGRVSNMYSSLENRTNITKLELKYLLQDLKIVKDNLNEIEL